jgi:hypothetical protein
MNDLRCAGNEGELHVFPVLSDRVVNEPWTLVETLSRIDLFAQPFLKLMKLDAVHQWTRMLTGHSFC